MKYIEDIYDDNLDVFVELEDGSEYTVLVGTPKNFLTLMNQHEMDFLEPGCPFIIVRKLTKEIIEEAVKAYAENDAYWLKFYHFAGEVDIAVFNRLQAEYTKYLKELDELDNS